MRLPHRLQGQTVKSQGGAGAYCGDDLAAQLVCTCCHTVITTVRLINFFLTLHDSPPNLVKRRLITWLQQSVMDYLLISGFPHATLVSFQSLARTDPL